MKSIVLAEKPSVGKDLGRVLGCGKKQKGFWEGQEYIVTWAMGHLVELAEPGQYDERYKTWSLDYLPMLPERMKHRVIRKSAGQFKTIQKLFRRQDVNRLVIATDAGREGELVARWIMRLGGWKGPFNRLWISSQTDTAIREGFRRLRTGRDYDNLFRAAESRAESDWIIGINLTRALTCKYDARLSAGRVQTPTLAMIVNREREIENFKPEAFWTIQADFGAFTGAWRGPKGEVRIQNPEKARSIAEKVRGKEAVITQVSRKERSEPPPLAYDLTSLQREANSRLGFSAKKTLQTLQGLYERHKILTYPRTDSRYITTDMVPTLKDRLKAIRESPYRQVADGLLARKLEPGARLVDDRKVRDHHAIIPTEQKVRLEALSRDERSLWDLVARRFLAVLLPPHRYESITLTLSVEVAGGEAPFQQVETFLVRGRRTLERGWKEVAGAEEPGPGSGEARVDEAGAGEGQEAVSGQDLGSYKKGMRFRVLKAEEKQGFTRPPARYTEGTLLSSMENAGRFLKDEKLKESIAGVGIGTPATRADIIEKLLDNYYIERRNRELVPTSRGYELLEVVPEPFKSPALTARWEQRLTLIAEGKEQSSSFAADIRRSAKELIDQVRESTQEYRPRNLSNRKCPMCGKQMLTVLDKKGKRLFACPSFSCGYEEGAEAEEGFPRRPSKKEKAMTRRLIREYSDDSKETITLGDLIKASREKKKNH